MALTTTTIGNNGVRTVAIDKFSEVYWTESDLSNALSVQDWPATDRNIQLLWEQIDPQVLEEVMISAGWDYIYDKIFSLGNKLEDYDGHINEEE